MSNTLRMGLIVTLCGVLLASPALAQQRKALAPGETAPDLIGEPYPRGPKLNVEWRENTLTLVNFWATWCEPCKREMPMLQAAHEKYGPGTLQVYGVTSEKLTNEELAEFVESMGLTYSVFRMPSEFRRFPTSGTGRLAR